MNWPKSSNIWISLHSLLICCPFSMFFAFTSPNSKVTLFLLLKTIISLEFFLWVGREFGHCKCHITTIHPLVSCHMSFLSGEASYPTFGHLLVPKQPFFQLMKFYQKFSNFKKWIVFEGSIARSVKKKVKVGKFLYLVFNLLPKYLKIALHIC
jgi:hypothetical protein